jgi:hypothetical protein
MKIGVYCCKLKLKMSDLLELLVISKAGLGLYFLCLPFFNLCSLIHPPGLCDVNHIVEMLLLGKLAKSCGTNGTKRLQRKAKSQYEVDSSSSSSQQRPLGSLVLALLT